VDGLDVLQEIMLTRDIKGIYLPTAFLMLGLSNMIVCKCGSEPIPADVTGPTGSSMVCFFYYLFHLFLWLPVGVVVVIIQCFRYRTSTINSTQVYYQTSSGDNARLVAGAIIGAFLVLVSSVILGDGAGAFAIFIASTIMNIVPALVIFAVGALITMPKRNRIKDAEQAGTGQPATRSQSKSEGSYKPQPEAEVRSR
jgi:uncharacterized membrane protein YjfL (UPF0719 family)